MSPATVAGPPPRTKPETGVVGSQSPRICAIPPYTSSAGPEAVELARMAGLYLDPWQEFVLSNALNERADHRWAAFEVGVTVSRQNGKGGILEARELAGLFLLGERFLIHSAHQFDTSLEAFRRLEALIDGTPEFSRRVKRIVRSHGEEGIELTNGQRIRFRTRTKGGGRGFTCDCLIYDEDMVLPESAHGATLPTLSARPNPQVWYMGSAVDQEVHEYGVVKSRLRQRALEGSDPSLAYFEWSVEADRPDEVADPNDPDMWARSNPALGIRISAEHIEREARAMGDREFAVERLGAGDWPDPEGESPLIPTWDDLVDLESKIASGLRFGFDVSPSRSSAAICAAGRRADGLFHVEVIEHRRGTGWLVGRAVALFEKFGDSFACDERGPAGTFLQPLRDALVEVEPLQTSEYAQACGAFFDACGVEDDDEPTLRHLGTTELAQAVRGAARRSLGDAWAWSRKQSNVDITPLVASTAALWRASKTQPEHGRAQW